MRIGLISCALAVSMAGAARADEVATRPRYDPALSISKTDPIACKIERDARSGRYVLSIINNTEDPIVEGAVMWSVDRGPSKVTALAQTRVVPGAAAVVADVDGPGTCTTWQIRRIGVDVDEE